MAFEKDYTAFASSVFGGASGKVWIDIYGIDLSGAAFVWAFADAPGGTDVFGPLTNQTAGTEGVSATYDAGGIHPISNEVVGVTRIIPQVDESTMEGLTFAGSADRVVHHTLYITPSGGSKFAYVDGELTIKQGAPS